MQVRLVRVVVTADADGQHLPSTSKPRETRSRLHPMPFGWRATFEGRSPPQPLWNGLTQQIFRLLLGPTLADTQTGLRGIPRGFLPDS